MITHQTSKNLFIKKQNRLPNKEHYNTKYKITSIPEIGNFGCFFVCDQKVYEKHCTCLLNLSVALDILEISSDSNLATMRLPLGVKAFILKNIFENRFISNWWRNRRTYLHENKNTCSRTRNLLLLLKLVNNHILLWVIL